MASLSYVFAKLILRDAAKAAPQDEGQPHGEERVSASRTMRFMNSVMILEALGQFVDILRRPARHFHSEMQTHLGQHFLDLVQRLAAEVRGTEHFRFRLLHEI